MGVGEIHDQGSIDAMLRALLPSHASSQSQSAKSRGRMRREQRFYPPARAYVLPPARAYVLHPPARACIWEAPQLRIQVPVMIQTLLLMRHGKAAWPEGVRDKDRPLAERGIEAVPRMADYAMQNFPRPDLVLVSDAARTIATFDLLHAVYGPLPHQFEPRLYNARALKILDLIRAERDAQTLLVIAHNPGLHELGITLADPASRDEEALMRLSLHLPTSGLIVLHSRARWQDWREGAARLSQFITPRLLGGVDED
jgi:phosphohistidine phosphatase